MSAIFMANPAGEMCEQQQRRLVAPVEVVEDDHERPDTRCGRNERAEAVEESVPLGVTVEGR